MSPSGTADVPAPSSTCPGHAWQGCGLCVRVLSALSHLSLWLAALHGAALLRLLFTGHQWHFLAAGLKLRLVPEALGMSQGGGHEPQQCGAERVRHTNSTAVLG